jgi:hypothetical protein
LKQQTYPAGSHDSIQYHFFCDDKLFAVRIFKTDSLEHHSAWLYDGSARTVLTSKAPIRQADREYLDVSADMLRIEAGDTAGRIAVHGAASDDAFAVEFKPGRTLRWSDTLEQVVHQPNIDCVVSYRGQRLPGVGYSKRYAWAAPPRYWGYRFLQGFLDDRRTSIWTADAIFGLNKYDYFKVLAADGSLFEAPKHSTAHKQNLMFAYVEGTRHEARFEEIAVWDQILDSAQMDSHLRQRYGRVRYFDGKREREGVAITEYCFGTLG